MPSRIHSESVQSKCYSSRGRMLLLFCLRYFGGCFVFFAFFFVLFWGFIQFHFVFFLFVLVFIFGGAGGRGGSQPVSC